MSHAHNPERYWYGLWGNRTFANGWCFGATPEKARENALADIKRWHPETSGKGTLTLQRDVSPAVYFDYSVDL